MTNSVEPWRSVLARAAVASDPFGSSARTRFPLRAGTVVVNKETDNKIARHRGDFTAGSSQNLQGLTFTYQLRKSGELQQANRYPQKQTRRKSGLAPDFDAENILHIHSLIQLYFLPHSGLARMEGADSKTGPPAAELEAWPQRGFLVSSGRLESRALPARRPLSLTSHLNCGYHFRSRLR